MRHTVLYWKRSLLVLVIVLNSLWITQGFLRNERRTVCNGVNLKPFQSHLFRSTRYASKMDVAQAQHNSSDSFSLSGESQQGKRNRWLFKALLRMKEWDIRTASRTEGGMVALLIKFGTTYKRMPSHRGKHANGREKELAEYVSSQRALRQRGKLSTEEIERMDSIPGFEWTARRGFGESVQRAVEFYAKHGDLPRQEGTREIDEDRLYNFLAKQRVYYHNGKLNPDSITLMLTIPDFDWGQPEREFEASVELVVAFLDKYGELPRRRGTRDDGDEDRLANFIYHLRVLYHTGQLSDDRIKHMTDAISDFDWGQPNREFEASVELVVAFLDKYGELPRQRGTRDDGDEYRLANFLMTQRILYRRGELSDQRISMLQAIAGWL